MTTLEDFQQDLLSTQWFQLYGRVTKVIGMRLESAGPHANVGDMCEIRAENRLLCYAEVVGFRDASLVLMPLGEISSIFPGADVLNLNRPLIANCSRSLLGRVLDGLGNPIDKQGPVSDGMPRAIQSSPPNPLDRIPIATQMQTGVRVIDGFLPVGYGQRMGIFAGSGVGKSTLLSMIARNTSADVNVIALIGERGREVREFIERDLGSEGMKKSVIVVATSDQPPLIRLKSAFVATTIAEYFRDQGLQVNLMMDSITRFCMAQREIGLAAGEPPTTKGYTPSVFAMLPKLLERSGSGAEGTITAFYTVLVDGDDMNEPIADAVRGILDGHIVLSRQLANAGRFPAIDVLSSLSRLTGVLASESHRKANIRVRKWMQRYREIEDLIRIGAFQRGLDAESDIAIEKKSLIESFLEQDADELTSVSEAIRQLISIAEGEE
ncbi:FliI/YscN family ATPase [Alicyclobacillus ferrooxydans]|uniref:ATP synthase n=1 Tax=Alicyclobacillus ferrooxydans TaxID=471514 RepID=A0A0P9CEY6_9BACL|nr:FliI/YscN family ATPase [Alicyclobacillus ferrooxydans]KPV44380.1 ATP synthase [Alicyclobacillus ferrooxydans]